MKQRRRWIVACTALLCILSSGLAFGQKVKVEGLITGRDGESLTVKSTKGGNVVVTLTDSTKVQANDPLAVVTWFQRSSRVREGVAKLAASLRYARYECLVQLDDKRAGGKSRHHLLAEQRSFVAFAIADDE